MHETGVDGTEVGVVFPQTEIGRDPDVVTGYVETVDGLGYDHLLAYEHVLGVDPAANPGWEGSFDLSDPFHEPLTLFSACAPTTEDLTFVTGILVLPQRRTALVAKQAAQLDRLASGRLRLGVANGWNELEYVALGADFGTRARRIEEQIEVLRRLWTERSVEFDGEFHELPGVGINPPPVQRPVPVWLGGMADPVLRRVARTGDGWIPELEPGERARTYIDRLREYAVDAGRDPESVGIQARLRVSPGSPEEWVDGVEAWAEMGAEYVALNPLYEGLDGVEHERFVAEVADELGDAGLL